VQFGVGWGGAGFRCLSFPSFSSRFVLSLTRVLSLSFSLPLRQLSLPRSFRLARSRGRRGGRGRHLLWRCGVRARKRLARFPRAAPVLLCAGLRFLDPALDGLRVPPELRRALSDVAAHQVVDGADADCFFGAVGGGGWWGCRAVREKRFEVEATVMAAANGRGLMRQVAPRFAFVDRLHYILKTARTYCDSKVGPRH